MKTHTILALICLSLVVPLLFGQSTNSQAILTQSIANLQGNPADAAMREKIIRLVLTMNPKPAVPDEVATHEGAAEYAFKNAKTVADFADAAKEYEKALLAAPWLAADYYNCGVAHEKAEEFDAAIRNFSLYLIAAPDAQDTTEVRKRIGAVKYQAEKAVEAKAETDAAAARQRQIEEAKRNSFEGTWLTVPDSSLGHRARFTLSVDDSGNYKVSNDQADLITAGPPYNSQPHIEINGRHIKITQDIPTGGYAWWGLDLSQNGNDLSGETGAIFKGREINRYQIQFRRQ
jgi:tetratricopeptide (TPR) repeat protein